MTTTRPLYFFVSHSSELVTRILVDWDVRDSKVVQLFKMAKASITGEQAKLGDHRELNLS